MTPEQLWQAALGELELAVSKANFRTWLANTFILHWDQSRVTIGIPSAFYKNYLEKHFHQAIIKALTRISDRQVREVHYEVAAGKMVKPVQPQTGAGSVGSTEVAAAAKAAPAPVLTMVQPSGATFAAAAVDRSTGLNQRFAFSTFIVGPKTELAHAACKAVAERPGQAYNPLFIYGGVGLGKTHLMQAVGNHVLSQLPNAKILYSTCEAFTNEYINSVQEGKAKDFQNKYRTVDVLLIDDIQFMAGKERTKEAFFNTFDHLHRNNKQVVLTSDRPPKAIPTLEDRLVSRFEWGIIVDVGSPDLETRIAILNHKLAEKQAQLSSEVVQAIAGLVQNNVRELESALNKVLAWAQLKNVIPTAADVKQQLVAIAHPRKGAVTSKQIISAVAQYYDLPVNLIVGSSRKKELVVPRQIAMYLMREELSASFPNIGTELGGRDHTTAMHAVAKVTRQLEDDQKIQQDVQLIQQRLVAA